MENIKNYEHFINENLLAESHLNEGVFSNIKERIFNKWNSLDVNQKVQIADSMKNIFENTSVAARYGLFIYILAQFADFFFFPNFKFSSHLIWIINGMYWLILLSDIFYGRKLKTLRIRVIRDKVRELKNEFSEDWLHYMFFLIGEEKDVQACIEKLIKDELLTKDLIHKTHDGTILIDMTGNFEKRIITPYTITYDDIDPLGEEVWTKEIRREHMGGHYRSIIIREAEYLFSVKFRCLSEIENMYDGGKYSPKKLFSFKTNKKIPVDDTLYNNLKKKIAPGLKKY